MLTLTRTLAGLTEDGAARLRGLLLRQLIRMPHGRPGEFVVLHLFLVPPEPGGSRYALYEVAQPLVDEPLPQVQGRALSELQAAHGDPRLVPGADQGWRDADPGRRGVYLGTGARFTGSRPGITGTTIARLVDHTAVMFVLDDQHQPVFLQSSKDLVVAGERLPPSPEIPALGKPPFLLIDALVAYLRNAS
ncbi:hypothetical protein GCM10017786_19840 [Amycolatopsis deserti]|uniref:Uncharacterized protein n=1 Tax=Amycolatopsis deserti TaxID=185696 RepID=A0ABQ3ILK6_9PSEU|nr:hypothetical protein [Amycolatopsis deserti]GHE87998.1 hypothetical protein GCM10017786_19840 [Amycolatopsis deserti]